MRLRWIARGTGLLVFTLFSAYLFGPQADYSSLNRTQTILLIAVFISLSGLVVAWQWELLGGAVNVAGVLAFYTLHFAIRASLPPPAFPLLAFPGVLFLISWWRGTAGRP